MRKSCPSLAAKLTSYKVVSFIFLSASARMDLKEFSLLAVAAMVWSHTLNRSSKSLTILVLSYAILIARLFPCFCLKAVIFNLSSSSNTLTAVVAFMASLIKSSATLLSPFNLSTSGATLFWKLFLVLSMSRAAASAFFKVWSNRAQEIPREKMVFKASPTLLKQPLCRSALALASSYSFWSSAILAFTLT